MLYRIFVEDFDRPEIVKQVKRFFHGFTILEGVGFYEGQQENCVVIEVDSINQEYNAFGRVESLARELKIVGHQSSILVQTLCPTTRFL